MLKETDRWKHLRQGLFRNVEPEVELVAMSKPVGRYVDLCTTETLPAFTARQSHESKGTPEDDLRLNQFLIKHEHHTPLEAVALTFHVNGITKSLQSQWDRNRIGVGWTYRSTRFVSADQNEFVYDTFDYIESESTVKDLLGDMENAAKEAMERFGRMRSKGSTKQDGRKIVPIHWNTPCHFYCNVRSLRYMFGLRLASDAEWEIRRMAKMMFDIVIREFPSLFSDLQELYETGIKPVNISKERLIKLALKMLSKEELLELYEMGVKK